MSEFSSKSIRLFGTISINGPIEEVFPLFSPQGERHWVPDWNPKLLHPIADEWAEGQIFVTDEEKGEAIWIVTRLDQNAHLVEYHRIEPGRYVARIVVSCTSTACRLTQVETNYIFIGLSEEGNAEIETMTQVGYSKKMNRWSQWINGYLAMKKK